MQIEDIIKKVMEEIKKQEKTNLKLKKMVIIGDDFPFQEELKQKYESTYLLDFRPCFDDETEFDRLLLAEISPNTLQKLSLAMDPRIGPVMASLIKGKEVSFLKEGLHHERYKETCPKTLYKTYVESVEKIMTFGIRLETLKRNSMEKPPDGGLMKKRLIGEKEIKVMLAQGETTLRIDRNSLITPLAQDLIRKYDVVIEKQEGGSGHANS